MKKRLLVFHPVIAPYRIGLFNELYTNFETKICMFQRNLLNQKFDYEKISNQFLFEPSYLEDFHNLPFVKIRKDIIKTIKEYNPDIVLVSEYRIETIIAVLYKIIFRKKFKIISIVDDSYDMIANNNHFSKKHKYLEKFLLPMLDNVINVEPRVADYFKQKYKKGIYFPIVQEDDITRKKYYNALSISNEYIERYDLRDKKILLFVGRLDKVKNLETLIKVFIKSDTQNCKLVIVGGGNLYESLKEMSNENVIFTGRLEGDNLYAWYNIAEMFILPSIKEPFGAVTNEALIGGCFSLISEKAGSSCLIENGKNGYVFNPQNEDEFLNVLSKAMSEIPLRSYPLTLRNNRMIHDFNYYIKDLIDSLNRCTNEQ